MQSKLDTSSPEFLSDMFPPHVVLIPGTADESWKAFKLLEEAHVRFRLEEPLERGALIVLWSGLPFVGLSVVTDLVGRLSRMKSTILRDDKHYFPDRVPNEETKEIFATVRKHQLAIAQAKLEEITQTKKPEMT